MVLAGLAGAGLTAVAGTRIWATAEGDAAGLRVAGSVTGADTQPLSTSLALVALAAWGVVLVVRGRVRRAVAVVGLLAGAGSLAAALAGAGSAPDDARAAAVVSGATGDVASTGMSAWYYLTVAGAAVTVVAFASAVRRSPSWPSMGARYDAPADRRAEEIAEEDLWRALDEGRDPT